ncbi:hypothetical protein [Microbacterium sp. CGR1]|nr:hypothetical protein [Microbacterium sp. CGR1]
MTELGGVVRVTVIQERGFARSLVASAVEGGVLIRPRRGWLAVPSADGMLISAARRGVVLTCRTQAARLGLWLHDDSGKPHVAVGPNAAGRRRVDAQVHWGSPIVPRHPDVLVDPIENVLAYIAECEPFERALATWESALNKSLVTMEALRGYSWKPAARLILERATPFADAGL